VLALEAQIDLKAITIFWHLTVTLDSPITAGGCCPAGAQEKMQISSEMVIYHVFFGFKSML